MLRPPGGDAGARLFEGLKSRAEAKRGRRTSRSSQDRLGDVLLFLRTRATIRHSFSERTEDTNFSS